MAKQVDLDNMYMKMARSASELSYAQRKKVGAILVIPDEGRFEGLNGMPSGMGNDCESLVYKIGNTEHSKEILDNATSRLDENTWLTRRGNKIRRELKTKQECLHAESNAIMKVARSHTSSIGGTMYCTLLPCLECAKLIVQAGIIRVVYAEEYPYPGHIGYTRPMGLELLLEAGVQVDHYEN